jgi:hypothetical protein
MKQRAVERLKTAAIWLGLAAALNLAWEIAQLPLYTLWYEPDGARLTRYLLHCVLGDVLIAAVLYGFAAGVLRNPDWPRARPWRGSSLVMGTGLAYTAFSEWYNVYQRAAWAYKDFMPLVAGLGLTPLLQVERAAACNPSASTLALITSAMASLAIDIQQPGTKREIRATFTWRRC